MKMYVLFTCDTWKMRDSMRFVGVFTNIKKLKREIRRLIKDGTFSKESRGSITNWTIQDLNNDIEYLYIEECINNKASF